MLKNIGKDTSSSLEPPPSKKSKTQTALPGMNHQQAIYDFHYHYFDSAGIANTPDAAVSKITSANLTSDLKRKNKSIISTPICQASNSALSASNAKPTVSQQPSTIQPRSTLSTSIFVSQNVANNVQPPTFQTPGLSTSTFVPKELGSSIQPINFQQSSTFKPSASPTFPQTPQNNIQPATPASKSIESSPQANNHKLPISIPLNLLRSNITPQTPGKNAQPANSQQTSTFQTPVTSTSTMSNLGKNIKPNISHQQSSATSTVSQQLSPFQTSPALAALKNPFMNDTQLTDSRVVSILINVFLPISITSLNMFKLKLI